MNILSVLWIRIESFSSVVARPPDMIINYDQGRFYFGFLSSSFVPFYFTKITFYALEITVEAPPPQPTKKNPTNYDLENLWAPKMGKDPDFYSICVFFGGEGGSTNFRIQFYSPHRPQI